jgi:hypothetical protein
VVGAGNDHFRPRKRPPAVISGRFYAYLVDFQCNGSALVLPVGHDRKRTREQNARTTYKMQKNAFVVFILCGCGECTCTHHKKCVVFMRDVHVHHKMLVVGCS